MDAASINEALTILMKFLACTALLIFITFMVFGAVVIYYTDKEMKDRAEEYKRVREGEGEAGIRWQNNR